MCTAGHHVAFGHEYAINSSGDRRGHACERQLKSGGGNCGARGRDSGLKRTALGSRVVELFARDSARRHEPFRAIQFRLRLAGLRLGLLLLRYRLVERNLKRTRIDLEQRLATPYHPSFRHGHRDDLAAHTRPQFYGSGRCE